MPEQTVHGSETPVRQLSDFLSVEVVEKSAVRFPCFNIDLESLNKLQHYQYMCLTDLRPEEPREVYDYVQRIKRGLNVPIVLLTFYPGNNRGNLHFIWMYSSSDSLETIFQKSIPVVVSFKPKLPTYHTHAMRRSLAAKFGRISSSVPPAVLRYFYWDLTGNSSAASNHTEAEIDSRVHQILDMEPEDCYRPS